MAFFAIPEALEVAEILAPFVEEGAITAQEALGIVQTPTEYVRAVANNPYVQAATGAGLLEWEDVKKGVARGYEYEADKYASKYNYTYSKGGSGPDKSVKKSVGKVGKLLRPSKIPDYYEPTEKKNTVPRKQYHRKFTPPENNNMSGGRMDVVGAPKYVLNRTFQANQGRTNYASPIVIRHNSKVGSTIAKAYCSINGNRTQELSAEVSRMASCDFYYGFYSELDNMHMFANRNLIVQTGIGTKVDNSHGISGDVQASAFAQQYKSYIISQIRIYDVSNMSDKSCYVTLILSTPKNTDGLTLEGCVDDVSFEENTGYSYIKWSDPTANVDDRTDTTIAKDEHKFNLFKHRYKVRRNWRKLATRTVLLTPGQRTKFKVMEIGPQMISKIYLDEITTASKFYPGYTKNVRFELRGADVVANRAAANTQVAKSSASIAIVESMHIKMMGVVKTKHITKYLNQELTGSLTTAADAYDINKYGRLPKFTNDNQANINQLTEATEIGANHAS